MIKTIRRRLVKIKYYERNFTTFFSRSEIKSHIESIKSSAREEMKSAINKDVYLEPEDAQLINDFIKKIQKDLALDESK